MNREKYKELLLRFAKEIDDVGVSRDLCEMIEAQYERHPNVAVCSADETTDRFTYRHAGYMIEAVRTVKLVVKKCDK